MAYTTINKSSSYFNTKLYTGTGSAQSLTGVGFQPDLVWTKPRSAIDNHGLYDVIRGATKNIQSHSNYAEQTSATLLTSFDSDGFSVGTNSEINGSAITYASWNWVGGGTGSSNTDGSITSTVSANQTSGFSIVKWTSGGSTTVGHGLNQIPNLIIMKTLNTTGNWIVGSSALGWGNIVKLNLTDASASSGAFQSTTPTASLFYENYSGTSYDKIAYCFAEKKGFSKFGSYTGNGSTDGTFVYTGFKPAWVMVKSTAIDSWFMLDNKRNQINPVNSYLMAHSSSAEDPNNSTVDIDFVSNGIKIRASTGGLNTSSQSYIYMCFAESPLVSSTGTPCTAR